mmetsp:Transcript_119910/g.373427  ORF Transcript_119910/g.373427 Transcript_119910/m.373427 type:complete len:346 (+) Transcript_119910:201-1238(+)
MRGVRHRRFRLHPGRGVGDRSTAAVEALFRDLLPCLGHEVEGQLHLGHALVHPVQACVQEPHDVRLRLMRDLVDKGPDARQRVCRGLDAWHDGGQRGVEAVALREDLSHEALAENSPVVEHVLGLGPEKGALDVVGNLLLRHVRTGRPHGRRGVPECALGRCLDHVVADHAGAAHELGEGIIHLQRVVLQQEVGAGPRGVPGLLHELLNLAEDRAGKVLQGARGFLEAIVPGADVGLAHKGLDELVGDPDHVLRREVERRLHRDLLEELLEDREAGRLQAHVGLEVVALVQEGVLLHHAELVVGRGEAPEAGELQEHEGGAEDCHGYFLVSTSGARVCERSMASW